MKKHLYFVLKVHKHLGLIVYRYVQDVFRAGGRFGYGCSLNWVSQPIAAGHLCCEKVISVLSYGRILLGLSSALFVQRSKRRCAVLFN